MTIVATHQVNFIPNAMQKRFIESRAKADLFSSRMGEGKSTALSWAIAAHTMQNPGAHHALIRDTFENLRATTQKTFFEWFPPGVFGTFNAGYNTFTWASGVADGEVQFLGLDNAEDAGKLQSRMLAGFAMDEPAPAVGSAGIDELIFDIAMSRLRQKNMKWYQAKLAVNNPDEGHWTYRKFVDPGMEGFKLWQPPEPENNKNLPDGYYAGLRRLWAHRPDLIRRFVDGEFGFQQVGRSVTPQWSDRLHLAHGLIAIPGVPLTLLWDWGHNPTCIITQKTPMGAWNILHALVGDDIGVEELVENAVLPLLRNEFPKFKWNHIGDPAGNQREQTSILRTPVRVVRKMLGGHFRLGPVRTEERVEPLRAVLARNHMGRGLVQVDKTKAAAVWHALRGGWHFNVSRTGIVSGEPQKNIHSHPGDAMGYGAAILFPLGRSQVLGKPGATAEPGGYFTPDRSTVKQRGLIGPGPSGQRLPKHGEPMLQSTSAFGGTKHGS
jgi:hypothetical protein